jgi:hypothetical protein
LLFLAVYAAAGVASPEPAGDAQVARLLAVLPESATIAADAANMAHRDAA